MTVIKFCGMTRAEDINHALSLGVDWLGFIHVPGTRRHCSLDRLKTLLPEVSSPVKKIIVVQDAPAEEMARLRDELQFDYFQFHGRESAQTVHQFRGYKVIHMSGETPVPQAIKPFGTPFLLDTQVGAKKGGTGLPFNWSLLPSISGPYLVAGGITPDTVGELVTTYGPWGVDVSSGIESEPGVKDHKKMAQFVDRVRRLSAS